MNPQQRDGLFGDPADDLRASGKPAGSGLTGSAAGGATAGGPSRGSAAGGPHSGQDSGEPPPRDRRLGFWGGLILALAVLGGVIIALVLLGRLHPRPAPEAPPPPEVVDESLGTRSVTVFFGNRDADGVVGETRMIQSQTHRSEEIAQVVSELIKGPQSRGVRTIPDGTRLRNAFYDEERRILYLDFSHELVGGQMGGSAMEIMTLTSILRTVAIDFPEVIAVQILVDGLEVETLAGHIDLTRPLRTKDWL